MTDKTSRNLLIPAAIPSSSGFAARELKDIAGQGSLYLRLMVPSDGLVIILFTLFLFLLIKGKLISVF